MRINALLISPVPPLLLLLGCSPAPGVDSNAAGPEARPMVNGGEVSPSRSTSPPGGFDAALQTMLNELARSEERGPIHQTVLDACRVLRYLTDGSVVTREEAGNWALGHWRPSDREDHDLIESALARETGADPDAAIDANGALFLGFRAEFIAKRGTDPKDQ